MKIILLICSAAALMACKSAPDKESAEGEALADVGVQHDVDPRPRDASPDAAASEPARLELNPPLNAIPPEFSELEKELSKAEPVGTIQGKIFEDAELLGVVREECGEGAIVQAIFRQKGKVRVSTPIRLPLFRLATREPVRFRDRIFRIESHFTEDSAERLKGKLTITYPAEKDQEVFIDLEVDAKPRRGLQAPRLDGKGSLPSYPRCTPTGYARVEADGRDWNFLVHATNVDEKGVPWVWLALEPSTILQLMVIAPKPNTAIEGLENPISVESAREKSSRPAVVLGKFLHTSTIVPDAEATSENLVPPEEATLFDGTISALSLVQESGRWRLRMTLEKIMISEMLDGELAGRELEKVRIDTYLAAPGDLEPRLGDPPEWWEKEK